MLVKCESAGIKYTNANSARSVRPQTAALRLSNEILVVIIEANYVIVKK